MVGHPRWSLRDLRILGIVAIAASLFLGSCADGNETNVSSSRTESSQPIESPPPHSPLPPLEIDLFSSDELFAAGRGGCGMTLLPKAGELPDVNNPAGMLLFHGIDEPMVMKVNQKLEEFELEDSQGEEFYGQKTQQTFSNAALGLIVNIQVSLGEPGEIESVDIPDATVRLLRDVGGQPPQEIDAIAVFGDAGC